MLLNRYMWLASWNLYLVQSTRHYVQMNHNYPSPLEHWGLGGYASLYLEH